MPQSLQNADRLGVVRPCLSFCHTSPKSAVVELVMSKARGSRVGVSVQTASVLLSAGPSAWKYWTSLRSGICCR